MDKTRGKRFDLLVAGRAGIDLNPVKSNCTFAENPGFQKSVGGSPANIAIGAAKLGLKEAFVGKVSHDGMGEYIREQFHRLQINTEGLISDRTGARNCLAILEIIAPEKSGVYTAEGDSVFHGTYLYREKTADLLLESADIREDLIAASRAVVLTGTAFSQEPSRTAMFQILTYAKKHDVAVTLDLDYRPYGWKNAAETAECYQSILPYCKVVIGNREEFNAVEYLTMPENRNNRKSAEVLLNSGVETVIVKDGKAGSWGFQNGQEPVFRASIPTKVLKTFGSGDAYAAGLLYGLLNEHTLAESIEFGTANASLALMSGISCSDSMPELETMLAHCEKAKELWRKAE